MENVTTIAEQEREYRMQLEQERHEERETQREQARNKTQEDHSESPNWALGIVMMMFAVPADLLGLIPVIGPVISGTMFGVLKLVEKLGNRPKTSSLLKKFPSNTALVFAMFFIKPKSQQKSSTGLLTKFGAKFKK